MSAENEPTGNGAAAPAPRVRVIGLGGAGANAVDGLELDDLGNVDLAVANTDAQALSASPAATKVVLGESVVRGLGAGGDVDLGHEAAEASRGELEALVRGVDLTVIVAGLGGGAGTAAAPLVAELAARAGALVLAYVTLPFSFEGSRRRELAEERLGALRRQVHGLVPLPNDLLLQEGSEAASVREAFSIADGWFRQGVRSVCSLVLKPGLVNQDLSSLRALFSEPGGRTLFGVGRGRGERRAEAALEDLFTCPLLHLGDTPGRADRLLVHLVGDARLGIADLNETVSAVSKHFGSREDVMVGAVIDESETDRLEICVIGKVDVGERGASATSAPERPAATGKGVPSQAVAAGRDRSQRAVHAPKLGRRGEAEGGQDELDLFGEEQQRGYFDKTDRNVHDGEDLDVPTFLRRGIKIRFKK